MSQPSVFDSSTLPLILQVKSLVDNTNGQVIYFAFHTDYYAQHETLFEAFEFIFVSPILPFTNFTVVSVATAVTVGRLRTALAWRVSASSAGRRGGGGGVGGGEGCKRLTQQQDSLTRVLILVSCLYIMCSAPSVAVAITRFAVPGERFYPWGRYSNIFFAVHDVSNTLAAVNSSFNFFIYLWLSSRYRKTLAAWLACWKVRRVG